MATYRSNQINHFLDLIRNFSLDVVDEGLKSQKIEFFADVILVNLLSKVSEFGFSEESLKRLERALLQEEKWDKIEINYLEKRLLDIFVFSPKSPCLLKINHLGEVIKNKEDHGLLIDIKVLADKLLNHVSLENNYRLKEVSYRENQLLELVRNEKNHTIKLYKKHGVLDCAESSRKLPKNENWKRLLEKDKFQNIEIKGEYGKPILINQTIKTKFLSYE